MWNKDKKGLIFVISAPAGTGKTTLAEMLCKDNPDIIQSISCTTRAPRTGEVNGTHYFFLSENEFKQKIQAHAFLEYAKVFDHYYGTTKEFIEKIQNSGKHVLLIIDTQGAMQLMKIIDAIFIFITPPSIEDLKKRMLKRHTEDVQTIEKRISFAEKELATLENYDYHIINDDLNSAFEVLKSIVIAEEHRIR